MKSRTSFFNSAIFRKDITRFFPIWTLYSIVLLLTMQIILSEGGLYPVVRLGECVQAFMFINMGYAFLVVGLLFGDLFKSRLCNAIHALPVRRETLFFTHCASGIAFSLVPNLVFFLVMALFVSPYISVALGWLGAVTISYLIFFGIALFCMICTGNIPGYTVAFLGLNFLSLLVGGFYLSLYAPMLYGIVVTLIPFAAFCPIWDLGMQTFVDVKTHYLNGDLIIERIAFSGWERLGLWGAVALALAVCALLLYRKRHLETAGDFICVKFLRPVFLLLYTLAVGLLLYLFGELWSVFASKSFLGLPNLPFLLFGLALGFFTGLMLLNRTTRVFGKRSWLGLGGLVAVLLVTLTLTRLDVLGITRYVPKQEDIRSVTIGNFHPSSRYRDPQLTTTDPADFDTITDMHRASLEVRPVTGHTVTVCYTLKSGREVTRQFCLTEGNPQLESYAGLLSRPEAVFHPVFTTREALADTFYRAEVHGKDMDEALIPGLIDAMLADCDAGTMAQLYGLHDDSYDDTVQVISVFLDSKNHRLYLDIFEDCVHTRQFLESHGLLDEFRYDK